MTLVKYEIFEEVIKTGSFTRASEKLNLTQSAVSHAISSLEKELGVTLFIREAKSIKLTENGSKAYESIEQILQLNRNLLQTNFSSSPPLPRVLKVGGFSSVNKQMLPKIIKKFNKSYPSIQVALFEGTYDEIDDWVEHGVVDVGFTNKQRDNVICIPFLQDELLLASSINREESIDELLQSNSIIMPTAPYREQIEKYFRQHDLTPTIHSYISDCHTIVKMISLNLGISIGPKLYLTLFEDLYLYPLGDSYYRQIYLTYRNPSNNEQYIEEFVNIARRIFSY
ncbi:LysR family transcriptional regulator [Pontibacillus litoralis]|uniref:LysR family transcriptional regulator n=1 Tax=Pontibacillus litoralis JSM 072002 TaxID=1385512 RepID=A0A0A5G7H2_9BACI|nr:LysR family transcriptional regulator [Pontibacillus litoralis]KGX87025.1 LysR family transcriptional regulator [Pontibacillus litoralis JSM 072002]